MDEEREENINCLEGMRCPACGSLGPFKIAVSAVALVYDDGVDSTEGDQEWDNDSYCECGECHHSGTVDLFTVKPGLPEKAARARVALQAYAEVQGDDESNYRDLLADMMHLAPELGISFDNELRIARDNYQFDFDQAKAEAEEE